MADLSPTLLFGLVTMGISEVLRRQFLVAYGTESHSTVFYATLMLALFSTLHVSFSVPIVARGAGTKT